MQLLWSIGSLLIKSSKCYQINITIASLTKQIVSDQFKLGKSIWYTQGQQIKLVKLILEMFFNARHTWLDQADQIKILRSSWSNQLKKKLVDPIMMNKTSWSNSVDKQCHRCTHLKVRLSSFKSNQFKSRWSNQIEQVKWIK